MSGPTAPGTETCGCCSGTATRTPWTVHNRPGLDQIAYRSGTHGDFRASLLAGLSRRDKPALSALRTRDDDDATIALLDAWAVACDILTFYNERLANESFLRTATERTSLQELGRLIGYRLDPGVAAETHLAFTIERPPAVPAPQPPDPGLLPPVPPASLLLETGLRVQSVPGPGEQPQTFEIVEDVEARPEWNALPVAKTTPLHPVLGRRNAWFAGAALGLKVSDAVLFASQDLVNDRWDVRLLTKVDVDTTGDRTHVTWDWGLGSFDPPNTPADLPDCFALRKRVAVFGHSAPEWRPMINQFRTDYVARHGGDVNGSEWPGFTSVTQVDATTVTVDLDGAHPDVAVGDWVVVSQETGTFYRELYKVTKRSEVSRSEFAVSGKVTRLVLEGEPHAFGTPRQVTVFAVNQRLTLVEAPDGSPVAAATFTVDGDATAMAAGRTLVLAGHDAGRTAQAELVTLVSATKVASAVNSPAPRTQLTVDPPAAKAYRRETAVVYGNVARATHGETVDQVLGSGDARAPFQSFPLAQGPLSHVQADTPSGSASTLTVRVGEVAWAERPSLFGAGPADRSFLTRTDSDGAVVVGFGDGRNGARLPSGSHNVRATYRKGLGAAGNVGAGALSQPLDRPLGLKAVTNPVAAAGGVDPEAEAHARRSMPLPVRTLGRAVSRRDYADFALAFVGIAVADAAVLSLRSGRTIVVTVAGRDGQPAAATTVAHLADALRDHGDPNVRVVVLSHRPAAFRLALKVRVAADRDTAAVLGAVRAALVGTYAPGARQLGQAVHRSAVIATAASVPGVVAVDLDRLYRGSSPSLRHRLLADQASVDAVGNPVAAELLALAGDPFDWLQEMP